MVLIAIPIFVIAAIVVAVTKRRPAQLPPMPLQLAPIPVQLQQADQLLAAGQIDPAEHAGMRSGIFGITD